MPTDLFKNPWLGIEPAKLNKRLDIQESVEVQDSVGQPIPTWTTLYSRVKAYMEPLSVEEQFKAQQIYGEVTHRIVIRYVPGVTAKHRILFGTKIYDLLPPRNIEEKNIFLEIMAKERT